MTRANRLFILQNYSTLDFCIAIMRLPAVGANRLQEAEWQITMVVGLGLLNRTSC